MTEEQHRGYGQYCPISRALEVLGERWTMLIVRDLLLGNVRFNELSRASPGLSRPTARSESRWPSGPGRHEVGRRCRVFSTARR